MELNYKQLKEAIENTETDNKIYEDATSDGLIVLEAAKLYLPILLHQEFIKPNEQKAFKRVNPDAPGNDSYLYD